MALAFFAEPVAAHRRARATSGRLAAVVRARRMRLADLAHAVAARWRAAARAVVGAVVRATARTTAAAAAQAVRTVGLRRRARRRGARLFDPRPTRERVLA